MKVLINSKVISNLKPKAKAYDVYDSKLIGLVIRVNPSGKMNYVCQYTRGRRITVGRVELITVAQARDRVTELLSDFTRGVLVKNTKTISLKKFILEHYQEWALTHLKSHQMAVRRIVRCFFAEYGHKKIDDITVEAIEKWRINRLNKGIKKETVNRDIATFKSALSKAYEWGYSESHPISKIKLFRTDPSKKIRYLTREEELRLRKELDLREGKLRKQRESANEWRNERNYPLMPIISDLDYVDHLKPMVLISMNTGIRQGELFQMKWQDIDFNNKTLVLGGEFTKNKRTRYIPLNEEAAATLAKWYAQSQNKNSFVFPSKDGKYFNNVRKSWTTVLSNCDISNFRWHDLRHHFASKLVMAKVDLNTVRELLGHSDIKMTLRYAHLAPEHKAAAVAKLNMPM